MRIKKTFFVALTTVAAALALSLSAGAVGLGETSDAPKPSEKPGDDVKTGDNSSAVVAIVATTGVAALGTAIVATKMKKKASK